MQQQDSSSHSSPDYSSDSSSEKGEDEVAHMFVVLLEELANPGSGGQPWEATQGAVGDRLTGDVRFLAVRDDRARCAIPHAAWEGCPSIPTTLWPNGRNHIFWGAQLLDLCTPEPQNAHVSAFRVYFTHACIRHPPALTLPLACLKTIVAAIDCLCREQLFLDYTARQVELERAMQPPWAEVRVASSYTALSEG